MPKNNTGIAVPCFNEEFRIDLEYWKEIIRRESQISWCFIDDGSSDNTFSKLSELTIFPNCSVIKLERNHGKGNAIRKGLIEIAANNEQLKFLGYIDSDGAFTIDDVSNLICFSSKNPQFDAVFSSRVSLAGRNVDRKTSRHYIGRIIATFLTWDWKEAPYDTQSGFKIFLVDSALLESINYDFHTKWFIDVELICRLSKFKKVKIWEEPVNSWRDVEGSRIRLKSILSLIRELVYTRSQVARMIKRNR